MKAKISIFSPRLRAVLTDEHGREVVCFTARPLGPGSRWRVLPSPQLTSLQRVAAALNLQAGQ